MATEATSKPGSGAKPRIFKAIIRHAYTTKGIEHVNWPGVGVAIESKNGDGFNLLIHTGLSVSGQIYLRAFAPGDDVPAFDYAPFTDAIR